MQTFLFLTAQGESASSEKHPLLRDTSQVRAFSHA